MSDNLYADMRAYSKRFVGPLMYQYALWIITEAHRRSIKTVWFLARDGYLLREIGESISKKLGLSVECKYLYCSRKALRAPTYHLIDEEERYSYLFASGYRVSANTLLARADLTGERAEQLLTRLGVNSRDEPLGERELRDLCEALRKDGELMRYVLARSEMSYPTAVKYMREQGLFDSSVVAIADSGWTGSMQRSLRILLESAGYEGRLVGFYFGMYSEPKDERDGEYLTFYFSPTKGIFRQTLFNNNVFECMLSAPHAMTTGYHLTEDGVKPCFSSLENGEMRTLVEAQIEGALEYAREKNENIDTKYEAEASLSLCRRIISRTMIYPRRKEAQMYSAFLFCDDVTEKYSLPLAGETLLPHLRQYMLLPRIFRKILGRRGDGTRLLWPYGVIALLPRLLRPWYRFNVILWDLLLALRRRIYRR